MLRDRYALRIRRGLSAAAALGALLVLGGCALFTPAGPGQTLRPGPGAVDASPTTGPPPSEPVAVPDPLHPERHLTGEEVEVASGTVVYLGLARSDGQIVARFQIVRGTLPMPARLAAPSGETVDMTPDGDLLESEPFGDAADPPAREATITLVVGDQLIPFEAGKVR
jgi:hypothetical protein